LTILDRNFLRVAGRIARAPCVFDAKVSVEVSGVSMFKGSFVTMAEAIASHLSAQAATAGAWRVADAWQEGGAPVSRASPSMRARLTVIRPSFSLHQVQSLPPR
jgi:hypothetical protein